MTNTITRIYIDKCWYSLVLWKSC